jgi:hypothetical protein
VVVIAYIFFMQLLNVVNDDSSYTELGFLYIFWFLPLALSVITLAIAIHNIKKFFAANGF